MAIRFVLTIAIVLSLILSSIPVSAGELTADIPNIVLIVADDLGYGDLACYGGKSKTPNLDRLAVEGIRFTDFHSNGPMCSATRTALLTGLYQHRFGREFEGALGHEPHLGLPLNAVTLPELLKPSEYSSAIFGKWHLGNRPPLFPTQQGFDEFRGLVTGDGDHHSHIDRQGQEDWWNGEKVEMETGYTADLITNHSVRFIEQNRDRPFFLYVPHLAIHFPWQGPKDPSHRKQGKDYSDDKWGRIRDRKNVAPHVNGMIESLDQSVGKIIATLKRLHLEENTFVFFTSDNGGYIHYANEFQKISSNGRLRGQKGELYEGGHRVPAIAWWPTRIAPRTCRDLALTFDLLPTILRLAGKTDFQGDGIELNDLLFQKAALTRRTVFWRKGDSKAAREDSWKLVIPSAQKPPELYDLDSDLSERENLAKRYPARVKSLLEKLDAWETSIQSR